MYLEEESTCVQMLTAPSGWLHKYNFLLLCGSPSGQANANFPSKDLSQKSSLHFQSPLLPNSVEQCKKTVPNWGHLRAFRWGRSLHNQDTASPKTPCKLLKLKPTQCHLRGTLPLLHCKSPLQKTHEMPPSAAAAASPAPLARHALFSAAGQPLVEPINSPFTVSFLLWSFPVRTSKVFTHAHILTRLVSRTVPGKSFYLLQRIFHTVRLIPLKKNAFQKVANLKLCKNDVSMCTTACSLLPSMWFNTIIIDFCTTFSIPLYHHSLAIKCYI